MENVLPRLLFAVFAVFVTMGAVGVIQLLVSSAKGQTMRVIPLEKSDAEVAKQTYQAMKDAIQAWERCDKYMVKKYRPESRDGAVGDYSEDFRFLLEEREGSKPRGDIQGDNTVFGSDPNFKYPVEPR